MGKKKSIVLFPDQKNKTDLQKDTIYKATIRVHKQEAAPSLADWTNCK